MPFLKKPKKHPTRKINRESRLKIYQSTEWLKLRIAKLQLLPLCEICLSEGRITPAEDIHHKDSFLNYDGLKRYLKAYEFSNLLAVCKKCHGILHSLGTTYE